MQGFEPGTAGSISEKLTTVLRPTHPPVGLLRLCTHSKDLDELKLLKPSKPDATFEKIKIESAKKVS